ncbi:MAG: DUF4406 domain-containing protein [Clostridiales bacterium]
MNDNPIKKLAAFFKGMNDACDIHVSCSPRQIAYIAGPISNCPNYKNQFNIAAKALQEDGYIVLNPAILPCGLDYQQYMDIGCKMLECCDVIFLLHGWYESPGAKCELKQALERNMQVRDFKKHIERYPIIKKELQI